LGVWKAGGEERDWLFFLASHFLFLVRFFLLPVTVILAYCFTAKFSGGPHLQNQPTVPLKRPSTNQAAPPFRV
jgi:hypothetical protein